MLFLSLFIELMRIFTQGTTIVFSLSVRVSAHALRFLGSPLLQTPWSPLMAVPNRPPPMCSLLKSNLSRAWFPTTLLLAFQKRVSIYMKLSNTIFRSKFDEDNDEERLLIDELLLIMSCCHKVRKICLRRPLGIRACL